MPGHKVAGKHPLNGRCKRPTFLGGLEAYVSFCFFCIVPWGVRCVCVQKRVRQCYVTCYVTYSLSNVAQTESGHTHSMELCFKPRTKPLEQKMAKKPGQKEAGKHPLSGPAKRA